MQIVIFIIILIHIAMYSKIWYIRVPCNFINISPEPCKGKRTSVPCFSWSLFFTDISVFPCYRRKPCWFTVNRVRNIWNSFFLNFYCLFKRFFSVRYIMSNILVLWVYPFTETEVKHATFPSVIKNCPLQKFPFFL
jgi:hypothetical protein